MRVEKEDLDAAAYGMLNAFTWRKTPQGKQYWCDAYYALVRLGTKDLNQAVGNDKPDCDMVRKTASHLRDAFAWLDSPQGYGYWADVYDNLSSLCGDCQQLEDPVAAYDRAMRGI